MSAGVFVNSFYESDINDGDIHPIRVQPETLAATLGGETNSAPVFSSETPRSPISAVVSLGKRQKGLRPRTVTLKLPSTSVLAGYKPGGTVTIPVLKRGVFAGIVVGNVVTYLGVTWEVIAKSPELAR